MKKIIVFSLTILMVLSFTACKNAYKNGVDYSDFPDKDIPIYDDAVVFEFEDDENEFELSYGTTDDIDDIIELYQDEFEDEDYNIIEEVADKDEYSVEGYIDDIYFEIEVEEATRDEREYFDYIVTITTEIINDENLEIVSEELTDNTNEPEISVTTETEENEPEQNEETKIINNEAILSAENIEGWTDNFGGLKNSDIIFERVYRGYYFGEQLEELHSAYIGYSTELGIDEYNIEYRINNDSWELIPENNNNLHGDATEYYIENMSVEIKLGLNDFCMVRFTRKSDGSVINSIDIPPIDALVNSSNLNLEVVDIDGLAVKFQIEGASGYNRSDIMTTSGVDGYNYTSVKDGYSYINFEKQKLTQASLSCSILMDCIEISVWTEEINIKIPDASEPLSVEDILMDSERYAQFTNGHVVPAGDYAQIIAFITTNLKKEEFNIFYRIDSGYWEVYNDYIIQDNETNIFLSPYNPENEYNFKIVDNADESIVYDEVTIKGISDYGIEGEPYIRADEVTDKEILVSYGGMTNADEITIFIIKSDGTGIGTQMSEDSGSCAIKEEDWGEPLKSNANYDLKVDYRFILDDFWGISFSSENISVKTE